MKFAWDLQIKYSEGGERAVTTFEAGKAGYEARSFRGLGVFSSSPVRTPSLSCCLSCRTASPVL